MIKLYVFSLVVGGGLVLLSLMSDLFDSDVDVDGDGGLGDASFAKLLATYGLLYFALGFGATGTVLAVAMGVSPSLHLPAALGTGFLSGLAASKIIHYLKRSDTGHRIGDDSWGGSYGTVLLPIEGARPGEVRVARGHRQARLRALPHASAASGDDPGAWSDVMVIEVRDGIAYVVPSESTRD